ncbi:MAG: ABC transporter ATP-binding protein [Noviherbaspirillum sp.]
MNAAYFAIRAEGLSRKFRQRAVLDDISFTVRPGEFVAVLGKSGSGKSTLLRALAGLDHDVEGSGLLEVADNRSVLFQDSRLLPWETVLANVLLGLQGDDARERALRSLADVGLAGYEAAWPNTLSGGEQQRVALARSLARAPALLLADEPFGALDALTRIRMHALLRRLVSIHRPAVMLVTHDVDEALVLADRVLVIEDGSIALDVAVPLPHPRPKTTPEFDRLRNDLLASLGVTAEA